MTKYNTDPSLVELIKDLQRRLRVLETANRLASASITGGGSLSVRDGGNIHLEDGGGITVDGGGDLVLNAGMLKVVDAQGQIIAMIGRLDGFTPKSDGSPQIGTYFGRDSGEAAGYCMTTVAGGLQTWQWTDRGGQGVIADDAISGNSLARPYMTGAMGRARYTDWPTTTSSTFEDIWIGPWARVNPNIQVTVGATSTASGTTGQVRVMIDGSTQVDSTLSVGFGYGFNSFYGAVPGGNHSSHTVTIQARRTAGTGAIAAGFAGMQGYQS